MGVYPKIQNEEFIMKKIRSLVAFLLSITLIAPLATLQACEENELELSPEDELEVQ